MNIKGTQLFVKALREEKVDTLFAYPGGMAIDLFDAIYGERSFEVVLPRHEQGLVHAADGYARATGKTGVCLVTSGPGATNLVTGIATANYDSVPLVCFTGQVPTNLIGNDAFQEVDIVGICRSICKYAVTVRKREDLGRIIKEAFYIAKTGKPGPVLVDIPKDIQLALGSDEYPAEVNIRGYKPSTGVHIGQLKRAAEMLAQAKRPLFLIGGGVVVSRAGAELTELAERTGVPVITTIMGKGAISTDHPLYIGNIGMHGNVASNTAVSECDLLFSVGTRFNDRITGKISEFAKNAQIVHIDIDAASISRNIVVDVPIVADAREALSKFLEIVKFPKNIEEWTKRLQKLRDEKPIVMRAKSELTPQRILQEINDAYSDFIAVTDVGQNQMWATQFLKMTGKSRLLTSGGLGTMGYGLPAALGAKLGCPDQDVVCITENDACGVDAIQVLLGCSVGKGNLLFHLRGKQAFSFYNRKTGKAVRLVLRPTTAEYQTKEERFRYLQDAAPAALFDVKPAVLALPERARLFQSHPCDGCGEVTAEHLLRLENGKKLCLDCFRAYNRFDV